MGSAYSKTKPFDKKSHSGYEVKAKKASKRDEQVTSVKSEESKATECATGNSVCERKDSKQFWISHLKFKRNSSLDFSNTGSCSKQESNSDFKTDKKQIGNHYTSTSVSSGSNLQNSKIELEKPNARCNNEGGKDFTEKDQSKDGENSSSIEPNSPVASNTKDQFQSVNTQELYNYLNDGALSPCICDTSYMLLIDTRDRELYEKCHILLARSSKTLFTELQSYSLYGITTGINLENALNGFAFVIVYGNYVGNNNLQESKEYKLIRELESYGVEPYLLAAGFEAFYTEFPFLCTDKQFYQLEDYKRIQIYPSIILPKQLYLGKGDQATNKKIMEDLKITHIVNITQEHKSAFPESIEYLTLQLDDVPQTQLINFFEKTTKFLSDAIDGGGCVMVHCNMGVSRSSSVTLAYLIKSKRWTLGEAYRFIKERRSCVRPNRGFLKQLATWEEMILGKRFTDPDDLWF